MKTGSPCFRITGVLLVALASAPPCAMAAVVPVPDNNAFAMFTNPVLNFDASTGAFSITGELMAVQFPGQVLSYNDPLVTSHAVVTAFGTFSGTSLAPATIDMQGVFSMTRTLSLGGRLLLTEVLPNMGYTQALQEWQGAITASTYDTTYKGSPWLNSYFSSVSSVGTVKPAPNDVPGTWVLDATAVPEPSTGALLMAGVAGLTCWRRRGIAARKPSADGVLAR